MSNNKQVNAIPNRSEYKDKSGNIEMKISTAREIANYDCGCGSSF